MKLSLGPFGRLVPYVKPHLRTMVVGGGLALIVSATEGAAAWLVKPVMDDIFIRRDLMMLKLVPLALLGVYLVKGVARFAQSYIMATVGERVVARLRRDLYVHLQGMPLAYFSGIHSADLISRMMNDINRLSHISSNVLVMGVLQIGSLVALTTVMFVREWKLTLLALTVFPLIGLVVHFVGRRLYALGRRTQRQIAQLGIVLQESFTGQKIVKAFGRERFEQERFDSVNNRLLSLALKNARTDYAAEPMLEIFAAAGITGALWYGGYRVIQGDLTPGTFFSFIAALVMLYGPARQLARAANKILQTAPSVERVFEVLDTPPAIADRPNAVRLDAFRDVIRFEQAAFRYPGADAFALTDVSLEIHRGEVIAFVGMSGAGKSTLMDLLPRFHDVTSGRITIDGHDLRDVSQESLRAQMGVVTQGTFLFSDSIYYNIAYGRPDASRDDVLRAARQAHAHDFITACEQGYETLVGERGVRLSGGQRQRLAIARAFLKDPPILILDEATSDLDAESEFMVQRALADLMQGRTVLVIAHRLATVRNADRIVVIHEGRVAEVGRHDELLARDGLYRRLHALQMAAPESLTAEA